MISIWEKQSFQNYDVIVVGAGISGLSTAASLLEKRAGLSVLVLERGLLPTGASTKNAGFACFGSLTELMSDRETMADEDLLTLVNRRCKGLKLLRQRLGDQRIDFQQKSGFELISESQVGCLDHLGVVNELLKPIFDNQVFSIENKKLKQFGFGKTKYLIENHFEGQIDTGKMISALWKYVTEKGGHILTGAEVSHFESIEGKVEVLVGQHSFFAHDLIICTNAFTPQLVNIPMKPGRGIVIAVKPEAPIPFEGTFHYEQGYFYFRDFYDKIIFGGGRNLDFETERTAEFEINNKILMRLKQDLEEVIIPGIGYEITDQWTGIMAFGDTKNPYVSKFDDHVYAGVRLGGMGVALGSLIGQELAELVLGEL